MSIYDKSSLVLIPSGTKTSKVYSQKPVNGDGDFTFTRSSAATRVNADGNIEKETQNLLLQSNDFDTTWTTLNASVTGGQADKDGGTDAWLLQNTGSSGRVYQTLSASGVLTYSVYAKAGNVNWMALYVNASPYQYIFFDLANVAIGTDISGSSIDATITDEGSGWVRCSVSLNPNGNTTDFRVFPASGNGGLASSGQNIYIQDAQLEQGLVARDVITTTTAAVEGGITDNVPRLDYTDASCPSLLLEPQRTNLLPDSEHFGSGEWSKGNLSVSANAATSPEGLDNAYEVTFTNAFHFLLDGNISVSSNTQYTFSFYVKRGTATDLKYRLRDATNSTDIIAPTSYYSQTSASEWKRIEVTFTTPATCTSLSVYTFSDGGVLGTAYLYGAQLEQGTYATSYIPTYGSAVTRNNDYMRLLASNFYSTTSYTYFLDIDLPNDVKTSAALWKDNDNLPTNGGFQLRKTSASGTYVGITTHTGSGWVGFATNVLTGRLKIALRYNNGVVEMWYNGTKSAQTFNVTGWNQSTNHFKFQDGSYGTYETEQFLFIPTALTDQEAIDLTTL